MIRLPNTGTYSLELITAQNGAQSVVSYSDATSSAYTGGTQVASITSATTTTICSTPAASTVRDVDQINIKNTYAGSHTVTVQVDANGTNFPLIVAALLTDESLNYTHGSGWCCLDANGNIKNSALTSMTSAQLAAILTDETGSGAAVFATSPTLDRVTVSTNSASAALTITQTGAGNALVVEDSASTDSTPFVVTADGITLVGDSTARTIAALVPSFQVSGSGTAGFASIMRYSSPGAGGANLVLASSRGSAPGTFSAVTTGDGIGGLTISGDDGTSYVNNVGWARWSVESAVSTGVIPSYFHVAVMNAAGTHAERFRIASDGTTTLGGTSTAPALSVVPVASQVNYVTIGGSATGVGLNIRATGSDSDVQMGLSSKGNSAIVYNTAGTGSHNFYTGNLASLQASITQHSEGGTANRYITLKGSNGGNPTIGTSGGDLAITPSVVGGGHFRATTYLHAAFTTATPSGGTGDAAIYIGTSFMGVFAGSGAPTVSAAKGSLYLRSDGTTTNNRMYVNTDGGTTWTAVTTVA